MPSAIKEQIEELKHLVYDKGEYNKAQKVLDSLEKNKEISKEEAISCSIIRCQILSKQGEFSKSIDLADKSITKAIELNNDLLLLALLVEKMEALWRKGDYQTQKEITAKAEMIVEKLHHKDDVTIQEKIGLFYMWKAAYIWIYPDLSQAIIILQKALQYFEKAKKKIHIASAKFLLGTLYNEKGDRDIGTNLQKQSLKDFEEIGNTRQFALALTNLAGGYLSQGDYQKALLYAERSLKLRKKIGNKQDIALTLGHFGNIRIAQGEYKQALKIQKEILALFEEINDEKYIPFTLGQIGNIYYYLDDEEQAFAHLQRGLKLASQLEDFVVMSLILRDLITKYLDLDEEKQAKIHFVQLQKINSQINAPLIDSLYHLCKALILKSKDDPRSRGKAEGILEYLLSSQKIGFNSRIKALISLCELLLVEFYNTGKEEIFEDLSERIDYLVEITKSKQAIALLLEGYRLKSLLHLIRLNIPKSIKILKEAQALAKEKKLEKFVLDIQIDLNQIIEKKAFWDKLKKEQKSLVDILKQTPLMNGMKRLAKETILSIEESQTTETFGQRKLFTMKI